MELLKPWPTTIGKVSLADRVDLDEMLTEILTNSSISQAQEGQMHILTDADAPLISQITRDIVLPEVMAYIKAAFDFDCKDYRTDTWTAVITDGRGMDLHLHSGSAHVTTALYLTDSKADLVLIDPRGNACRGYPGEVRKGTFGDFRIRPRRGDLYIFPCYLQHYVATEDRELRVSVLTDVTMLTPKDDESEWS